MPLRPGADTPPVACADAYAGTVVTKSELLTLTAATRHERADRRTVTDCHRNRMEMP